MEDDHGLNWYHYEAMANNKDIIYAFYDQKYDDAVGSHYLGGRQSYTAVGDSEYGYLAFNKFAKDNLYGYRLIAQGQYVKGDKKYFTIKKNP